MCIWDYKNEHHTSSLVINDDLICYIAMVTK